MRKFVLCLLAVLVGVTAVGQEKVLSAMYNSAVFYSPADNQPYVETYLLFDGGSLNYVKGSDGKYRATVEIVLMAKSGDSIVFAKKYDLNSPAVASEAEGNVQFYDLQRIGLKNGIYTIELSIKDKASSKAADVVKDRVVVNYEKRKPAMSELQLMSSVKASSGVSALSRHGYDMEPYLDYFVPATVNQLYVYYEVYNINKEIYSRPFVSYVFVEEKGTGRRIADIGASKRHESGQLVPIVSVLDISGLPSGNYDLVVELHDRNNDVLMYKRMTFQRSNPGVEVANELSLYGTTFAAQITDENKLNYYLDALYPISSDKEITAVREMVRTNGRVEEKQAFLYNFWEKRYGNGAEAKWKEYKGWLEYVDVAFKYPRTPGYRTDRGRVYLQYGPPDFIRDEKSFVSTKNLGGGVNNQEKFGLAPNPSQGHIYYLPYQLWRYNKLETDDPNRVFLFWDEMRSGNYKLLNSNARGEVREEMWERRLCQQQLNEGVVGEVGEQFERGY